MSFVVEILDGMLVTHNKTDMHADTVALLHSLRDEMSRPSKRSKVGTWYGPLSPTNKPPEWDDMTFQDRAVWLLRHTADLLEDGTIDGRDIISYMEDEVAKKQ